MPTPIHHLIIKYGKVIKIVYGYHILLNGRQHVKVVMNFTLQRLVLYQGNSTLQKSN